MLVALAVWFNRNRIKGEKHAHTSFVEGLALLSRPRFAFGTACIFLYVGAEVSIGSLIVNYLQEKSVLDISAGGLALHLGTGSARWSGASWLGGCCAWSARPNCWPSTPSARLRSS
jgi:FHS family L-fucose permease-like MFS transporter